MALSIKKQTAHYVASAGVFLSMGLVLHYAEGMLPVFQLLPGGRLGLANIATLLAYAQFGGGFALLIGLLRCFLTGVFAGSVTMIVYGGTGTLASLFIMWLTKRLLLQKVSVVGRSMLGAFFYNAAQVLVCALVLENAYVFLYLPSLTLVAAISGMLTGIAAERTMRGIFPYRRNI